MLFSLLRRRRKLVTIASLQLFFFLRFYVNYQARIAERPTSGALLTVVVARRTAVAQLSSLAHQRELYSTHSLKINAVDPTT
jgi:hypothetical protein